MEYIVNIKGSNTIEDIQLMIAGVEAAGAEFVKSSISYHDHTITNLVTFNDLPPGERPQKPLMLSRGGATTSDGMALVWAGVMLIGGTNAAVTAFR